MRTEVAEAEADIERLTGELRVLMLPTDPNDERNVIVEIRGRKGARRPTCSPATCSRCTGRSPGAGRRPRLGSDPSDLGGYNEVVLALKGDGVWSRMHHEAGPHRVQRVPVTESQGRIHTSSATVTVLPEAEEVDVALDPNDLRFDVFRSSGPGARA